MDGTGYLQTGQVTCHDAIGREIVCAASGQDDELRRGAPRPEPRFETDKQTVTDRLTGFGWCRNANLAEFPLMWPEALALDYVAQMNCDQALGSGDWRLSNRRELRSLIGHRASLRQALPEGHPFTNLFSRLVLEFQPRQRSVRRTPSMKTWRAGACPMAARTSLFSFGRSGGGAMVCFP
jgi:hypothetical protein